MKLAKAVQTSRFNEKGSLTYDQLSLSISTNLSLSPTSASFRELPLIRTLRFKLMRSKKNRKLHREIERFCRVYNHFIAVIERYYRLFKKHPSANRLKMLLPKLKRTRRFLWLKTLPSQALQDVVERIDRAYKRFFKERKKGRRCGKPHFKQPENYKSFTLKQAGWELVGEHSLRIGANIFKFHKSREIPAEKVKTVTVKRDKLGDIHVFFVVKSTEFVPKRCATGQSVGIDFGFDQFLTLSDGTSVNAPMFSSEICVISSNSRVRCRERFTTQNRGTPHGSTETERTASSSTSGTIGTGAWHTFSVKSTTSSALKP